MNGLAIKCRSLKWVKAEKPYYILEFPGDFGDWGSWTTEFTGYFVADV